MSTASITTDTTVRITGDTADMLHNRQPGTIGTVKAVDHNSDVPTALVVCDGIGRWVALADLEPVEATFTSTPAASATNPGKHQIPGDLRTWLERRIDLDREANDPDGFVAGMECVLQALLHGDVSESGGFIPVLSGMYTGRDAIGDALAAVAYTMLDQGVGRTFKVTVEVAE